MKVGIVTPVAPGNVIGGAERLWRTLQQRLIERGHDVELVAIPTPEATLAEVLDSYETFLRLDVSRFDVVITGKYPAWMVQHPRHLVYLLHPLRGLYDTYPDNLAADDGPAVDSVMWNTGSAGDLIDIVRGLLERHPERAAFPGPFARGAIQALDRIAFGQVTRFAAISEEVAGRDGYLPADQPVLVVHPESDLATACLADPIGHPPSAGRFLAVSRLDRPKRIDLVLAALAAFKDPNVELIIAGDGPDRARLEQLAEPDARVSFVGRVSEAELRSLYREATGAVFTPFHEDYGYIAAEAMSAGTPVVTTVDSGGPTELVEHGVNGMLVRPDPLAIAGAMAHLAHDPFARWTMGLNARRRVAGISFDPLLDLVESIGPVESFGLVAPGGSGAVKRPRALVLSTYPIEPAIGGGQRRLRHLSAGLAEHADVTVLVPSSVSDRVRRRVLEPGLVQVEIPRSVAQREAEEDIYALLKLPVDDITAGELVAATSAFDEELRRQLIDTDVVVASHPFLVPALPQDLAVPLIHESQNFETRFKAAMLPDNDAGRWLTERVRVTEIEATRRADAVVACTESDLVQLQAAKPGVAGLVVPNGVDAAALPLKTAHQASLARQEILGVAGFDPDDERPLGVFIGSWHPPNIDAARLLLDVARQRPDWVFVLAGSHTSEFAGERIPDNVHLIAIFAESLLWPLLAGATVALNPMISGGGSNLKVFDYLSVGTPVLTTEVGARGLDDPTAAVVVCDPTVSGFVTGLDRMVGADADNLRTQQNRIARGRELVEQRFDWHHLARTWAEFVLSKAGVEHGAPTPTDTRQRPRTPVILAETPPPPIDPIEATIRAVGRLARTTAPSSKAAIVDPLIQESIKQATENRHVGRLIPDAARLRFPKRVLVRAGQLISNEQLNYNEAMIDAVTQLAIKVEALRKDNQRLQDRIDELETRAELEHQ